MGEIVNQFGIQPIFLAAQVVNFLLLLFILKKILYKPLLKVLDERRQKIAESLKNAEEIENKLAKTEEDREKKLEVATKEAKKIIEEATKNAGTILEEAHTKAANDIAEMIQSAQNQIRSDREKMQQEIREELAELVIVSLEKITGKALNSKDQKTLIDKTIKELK